MLPSCRQFLRFIGADKKADAFGFTRKVRAIPGRLYYPSQQSPKPGAAVKLNQYMREGCESWEPLSEWYIIVLTLVLDRL